MIFLVLIGIILLVVFGFSFVFFADENKVAEQNHKTMLQEEQKKDTKKGVENFLKNIQLDK